MSEIIIPGRGKQNAVSLSKKYEIVLKQLMVHKHLLSLVSARLMKYKPDDKIFHDETFVKGTLDNIANYSQMPFDQLNQLHGKEKTITPGGDS